MSPLLARRSLQLPIPDTETPFSNATRGEHVLPDHAAKAFDDLGTGEIDLDSILSRLAANGDNTGYVDAYEHVGDLAPDLLRDVILPVDLLSNADCHDIYRRHFRERIEELLGRELPAVKAYVGEPLFSQLIGELLACQRPSAALFSRAGEALAVSFSASRLIEPAQRVWLAELAALELSIARAARVPQGTLLELDELLALPFERWASAQLEPVASLELVCFEHRVDDLYEAWLHGEPLKSVDRRPQWLAVLRQGSQVQRVPMSRRAWLLLSGLCVGRPVASSFFDALGWSTRRAAQRRVHLWLRTWVENGFFRAVRAA